MSASSKKKIRKELKEAKLTERQKQEKKESKKLKIYSITFTILIVGILLVTLFFGGKKIYDLNKTKWTTALEIGDHELNCVEMNYYYRYAVTSFMQQNGNSLDTIKTLHGVDMTKALDSQKYYDEANKTWADFFMDEAVELATSDYVMYDKAVAAGFKLSADQESSMNDELKMIESQATSYGYPDIDDYVEAYYGVGADYESFKEFLNRNYVASAYQQHYAEQIVVSEDKINEYNAEHAVEYNSYSYNSYTITISSFETLIQEEATKATENKEESEEGTEAPVELTAEQKEAAKTSAHEAAETLKKATSVEEFNTAIAGLKINEGKETPPTSTENSDVLYGSLAENQQEWISDASRKAGDTEIFENTKQSTDSDVSTEELTSYTVVIFVAKNENNDKLDNVRHIFIELEDEETSGETDISEDAYANAEAEANKIYEEWKKTGKTEADFIKLVNQYSQDTGVKDGLYENVSKYDSYYYGTFSNDARDWAVDPARKAGDCAVITGDYGCHVMYYVGESTESYRHFSISTLLQNRMAETWYNETIAAAKSTVVRKNTGPMDFSTPLYQTDSSTSTTTDEHEGHDH